MPDSPRPSPTAPIPADEADRLSRLAAYDVFGTPAEAGFDDLTRLAAAICGTPAAAVSLIGADEQHLKSRCGLDLDRSPRDVAFCAHAIAGSEPLVVTDATQDPRFAANPLVTGAPGIRFYAGVPLRTEADARAGRSAVGTLCVTDTTPRTLTAGQLDALAALARQAVAQLELRRGMAALARSERAAREAGDRLGALAGAASDAILCADAAGRITYANPAVRRMFGHAAADLLGRPLASLTPERLRAAHERALARIGRQGSVGEDADAAGRTVELVGLRADGTEFPAELSFSSGRTEAGEPFFAAIVRDVTDRKRAESALDDERRFVAAVLEDVADGIVACDAEGLLSLFNRATRELHGLAEEAGLAPEHWAERYDMYAADGRTPLRPDEVPLRRAFAGEVVRDAEVVVAPRDGRPPRRLLCSGRALLDGEGRRLGAVVGMHDVTEQRRAEDALRASERRFHAFMDATPAIAFVKDADRRMAYVNRAMERTFGRAAADWVGRDDEELWPADVVERLRAVDAAALASGGVTESIEVVPLPGGRASHWLSFKFPIPGPDGRPMLAGTAVDVTARLAADHRFRVLFEHSSDAHLLVDQQGLTIDCNNAAIRLLGVADRDALIGQHPGRFSPEFQPDGRRSAEVGPEMDAIAQAEGQHRFEWVHRRADDGAEVPCEVTLTSVPIGEGRDAVLAVLHDLTGHKAAERALRDARDAAERFAAEADAASRAKSAFLANMSHEIRTPMAAILGFVDLMADPSANAADRAAHAETVRRNGEHLMGVINDILDSSKIEAGQMTVERLAIAPGTVLDEVEALVRPRAAERGVILTFARGAGLPGRIAADPLRLRQVVLNLVSNALKFTEPGGRIDVRVDPDAAGHVRFVVEDTGCGMTAAEVARLFRPFQQADGSTTRRFGGTGLGLAISRGLATLLGGTLDVESRPGRGSTFTLRLPAGDASAVPEWSPAPRVAALTGAPVDAVPPPRPLAGRRVLLAEDSEDVRRLIVAVLESAGASVTMVDNGRGAVDAVDLTEAIAMPYDVVLMDMQMPTLDGYAAAGEIRRAGRGRLPIVALTAHAMAGERERCVAAGCDDYASKPIDRAALIALVARFAAHGRVAAAAPVADPSPQPEAESIVRGPVVRSARADDPIIRQILPAYVAELPGYVERLEAELARLVSTGEAAAPRGPLWHLAHRLKGSGGGYGFDSISKLGDELQRAIDANAAPDAIAATAHALVDLLRRVEDFDATSAAAIAMTAAA